MFISQILTLSLQRRIYVCVAYSLSHSWASRVTPLVGLLSTVPGAVSLAGRPTAGHGPLSRTNGVYVIFKR